MTTNELQNIPFVFIIGRPRSGTTLLATLLDAHPNIILPFECPVILNLYPKYGKIKNWKPHQIVAFLNDLKQLRKFNHWNIDIEEIRKKIYEYGQIENFQTIIKCVYSCFPSFFRKEKILYLGDKNPIYSLYFKKIFRIFPEARYIHLLRDYRDNILSVKKLDFEAPLTSIIASRWKFANSIVHKMSIKYPTQFYTIRYENLIENPETEIKNINHFLGIEYQASVLNFHLTIEERIKSMNTKDAEMFKKFHSNLLKPINVSKSGVWKTEMSEKDIKLADLIAGKWASRFNYQRKYHTFNPLLYIPAFFSGLYIRSNYCFFMLLSKLPYPIFRIFTQKGPLIAKMITKLTGK